MQSILISNARTTESLSKESASAHDACPCCPHVGVAGVVYWVAVKELNSNCHIGETVLFSIDIYSHSGNLF